MSLEQLLVLTDRQLALHTEESFGWTTDLRLNPPVFDAIIFPPGWKQTMSREDWQNNSLRIWRSNDRKQSLIIRSHHPGVPAEVLCAAQITLDAVRTRSLTPPVQIERRYRWTPAIFRAEQQNVLSEIATFHVQSLMESDEPDGGSYFGFSVRRERSGRLTSSWSCVGECVPNVASFLGQNPRLKVAFVLGSDVAKRLRLQIGRWKRWQLGISFPALPAGTRVSIGSGGVNISNNTSTQCRASFSGLTAIASALVQPLTTVPKSLLSEVTVVIDRKTLDGLVQKIVRLVENMPGKISIEGSYKDVLRSEEDIFIPQQGELIAVNADFGMRGPTDSLSVGKMSAFDDTSTLGLQVSVNDPLLLAMQERVLRELGFGFHF